MKDQAVIEIQYKVMNKQTLREEFTGTLEECTQYIIDFGLGWSFLYIADLPDEKKEQTVRMINT